MKKNLLSALIMLLSVFTLCASSDSIRINALIENDSAIERKMDAVSAEVDTLQAQVKSLSNRKFWNISFDVLNFLIVITTLIVTISSLYIAAKSYCIAFSSLKYTKLGYKASKRTADNVMRMTPDIQIAHFNDLIRHLYRDLVVTLAFSQKVLECLEKGKDQYPSEEHLLKLSVLPEEVCLENYNNDAFIYHKMHKLKILFRNYDAEISTALNHLKANTQKSDITVPTKKNTLGTLIYRPLYLIEQILEISDYMKRQKEEHWKYDIFKNAALIITQVHVDKVIKWKEGNTFGFNQKDFKDLNKQVTPQSAKEGIQVPYNKLTLAQNLFYKRAATNPVILNNNDIFDSIEQFSTYQKIIDEICRKDRKFNAFNTKIVSNKYDFKENFLTMLSIDVTIELSKIHMIDIN